MPETRDDIEAAAISWEIRLRDARAEEWEEFVGWLESDPAHLEIYEEVALAEFPVASLSDSRTDEVQSRSFGAAIQPKRRMVLGWAVAASLVATLGYVTLDSTDNLLRLETAAGARRSHTLADGSRIDLNGATVLVLDRTRPRFAKVEKGEALFTVVHDPERPFGVEAGGTYIKDVGTVFNVAFSGGELEVAVAEGEVILNPNREAVNLSAGMVIRTEGARAVVSRTEVESIGGWRAGRLSYDAASFSKIAQDLSRNLGIPVKLDPQLAKRRFSGVIVLDPDRTLVLRRVAGLLEVDARRTGDGGWNLTVAGAS